MQDDIAKTYACDVLVIGSGPAGYCAAIQAGRCGMTTILLEKDEVLGGNSGPNLGVGITGADRYSPYATETGIIHEMQEEAAWIGAYSPFPVGAGHARRGGAGAGVSDTGGITRSADCQSARDRGFRL